MPVNRSSRKKQAEGRRAGAPAASKSKSRKKKNSLLIYNAVTVVLVVGICLCGYTVAITKIDDSTAAGIYNAVNEGRTLTAADPDATLAPDQTVQEWNDFPTDYIPPLDAVEDEKPSTIIPPTQSDKEYGYVNQVETIWKLHEEVNPAVVAFIYVPGLKISYPVCQTGEGSYYETHDYEGNPRKAGAIFMSDKSSINPIGRNIVIHGHNMKDETMFGNLKNYVGNNSDFIKMNNRIYLDTLYGSYRYEIFAAYIVDKDAEEYRTVGFASDDSFLNWCNTIQSMGKYTNSTTFTANDRILTLSTCHDSATDNRTIIHAKLVWPDPNQTGTESPSAKTQTPSATAPSTTAPTESNLPDKVRVSLSNENGRLNIRKEPSTESGVVVAVYHGTVLKVIGEEGDWYKVMFSESDTFEDGGGYVHKDYVVPESG